MNKDNAKQYLPILQALAEGKTIQVKDCCGKWGDCTNIAFTKAPACYRIKPEPREIYELRYRGNLVVRNECKNRVEHTMALRIERNHGDSWCYTFHKYVEVLEGE